MRLVAWVKGHVYRGGAHLRAVGLGCVNHGEQHQDHQAEKGHRECQRHFSKRVRAIVDHHLLQKVVLLET